MILSLDPGLASFGSAWLSSRGEIRWADAIETSTDAAIAKRSGAPPPRRRSEKTSMELAERTRRIGELWTWLVAQADALGPPAIIVAEAGRAMGLAGSSAIISLSAGSTVAMIFALENGCPIVWATPREWRRHFVPAPAAEFGKRQRAAGVPTDDELYAAIGAPARRAVDAELSRHKRKPSLWPHALDAVGQGRWALSASVVVREAVKRRTGVEPGRASP